MKPLIIAHRGGSLEAPENTLGALFRAVRLPCDWQEIDVTLSRDGIPVVIHDDTVDRTTFGTGWVEQLDIADLQALTLRLPDLHQTYLQEKIPTLQQVLSIPGIRLMIEMKKTARVVELAKAVVQAVVQAKAHEQVALASFELALLQAVHRLNPALPLIGIVDSVSMIEPLLSLPLAVLAVHKALLKDTLRQKPDHVPVWVWTVQTVQEAQDLFACGADGLITDIPQTLLANLPNLPKLYNRC